MSQCSSQYTIEGTIWYCVLESGHSGNHHSDDDQATWVKESATTRNRVMAARADALLDAAAWIRDDPGLHTGAVIAEWLETRARRQP